MSIGDKITFLRSALPANVNLVAVSKTNPVEAIREAYAAGQRVFGESRPQEMLAKYEVLPKDIEWHMIGHLQTNKVKYIAPFVSLIHSVDSIKLLNVINSEAIKCSRVVELLLEVYIAEEDTKTGWNQKELTEYIRSEDIKNLSGVRVRGLMGIATYTDDKKQVESEFRQLKVLFDYLHNNFFGSEFDTLSMGMSDDYPIAIECGSTMVRVGSYIFGNRTYK